MIDSSRLNKSFVQQINSCVLSSYGIIANYFVGADIPDVFKEYCRIFNLPFSDEIEAEISSSNHLNWICRNILQWRGCQMINYLHNLPGSTFFSNNQRTFSSSILAVEHLRPDQTFELCSDMKDKELLATIVTPVNHQLHAWTVGYVEEGGLFIHNSQAPANNKLTFIPDLLHLFIRECITYQMV